MKYSEEANTHYHGLADGHSLLVQIRLPDMLLGYQLLAKSRILTENTKYKHPN